MIAQPNAEFELHLAMEILATALEWPENHPVSESESIDSLVEDSLCVAIELIAHYSSPVWGTGAGALKFCFAKQIFLAQLKGGSPADESTVKNATIAADRLLAIHSRKVPDLNAGKMSEISKRSDFDLASEFFGKSPISDGKRLKIKQKAVDLAAENGFNLCLLGSEQALLWGQDKKCNWQGSIAYLLGLLEIASKFGRLPDLEEQAVAIDETLEAIASARELTWKLSQNNRQISQGKLPISQAEALEWKNGVASFRDSLAKFEDLLQSRLSEVEAAHAQRANPLENKEYINAQVVLLRQSGKPPQYYADCIYRIATSLGMLVNEESDLKEGEVSPGLRKQVYGVLTSLGFVFPEEDLLEKVESGLSQL